jgi:hypothetical protein
MPRRPHLGLQQQSLQRLEQQRQETHRLQRLQQQQLLAEASLEHRQLGRQLDIEDK